MSRRALLSTACASVVSLVLSALLAYSDSAPDSGRIVVPAGGTITPETKTEQNSVRAAPSIDGKAAGDFRIWRTITLGTHRDVSLLLEDLASLHCGVENSAGARRGQAAFIAGTTIPQPCTLGDSAGQIIGRPAFTLNRTKMDVDLVVLSTRELGLEGERASVADIYARAKQLGLELCSAEVGPQLRLQYLDQPVGEFLRIAMQPIATYGGSLIAFTVANGGASLSLIGGDVRADVIVHASARFVFVRPTQIAQPAVR